MNWLFACILLVFMLWALPAPLEGFVARSTGCHHNGTWYADKSLVPTVEKCLNCQCSKKTLVCRMKVCPEMPMPPPRGCVVVQKKHSCCPYLSCARLEAFYKIPITRRIIAYLDHYERESIDRVVNENMLQRRSDDSEVDLFVCVKNGTVYKSGSAMSSSNLCTYCYCIGGTEKCVKPKCMLPVEGCKPIFVDSTCCPVRYDCSAKTSGKSSQEVRYRKTANKHFQRMSQRLQRNRGCTVNKQFYAEGQKMKSDVDKPCDICFCIRGTRRCAPKKCAPALKNCIPVVPKGQCCPSSYDCGSQRDYRRAQSSRQFNLFSLLFGKDEDKTGASTIIPEQYPHDRDPAITANSNKYKTHEQALTASSEKSILDTIREGLEFIDGNTNQMLETNKDLIGLQSAEERNKRTTAAPASNELSSTTDFSFLDLILAESNDKRVENEHAQTPVSKTATETNASAELSWVDLLLGPSEERNNETTSSEKVETIENDANLPTTDATTTTNIERIDNDVESTGSSGEIYLGATEAQQVVTQLSTTTTTSTAKPIITTPKTIIAPASITSQLTELESTTKKPLKMSTTRPTTTLRPAIKPIPLHSFEALEETLTKVEQHAPSEFKVSATKAPPTTTKPLKKNDLLAALLDGISDILGSEKVQQSNASSTTTEPTSTSQQSLPVFKPLPPTRINSKIANLTVSPPALMVTKHTTNTTFKPLPPTAPKLEEILKTNQTNATQTVYDKPKTTQTPILTTVKPLIIKTNPTILEAEPQDDSTEPTLPPSLPNLKIIPFLPTDAVQTDNNKLYEYFPGSAPAQGLYDDSKLYPAITERYSSFSVDLDDENKAKYIYKFKVEGPEVESATPTTIAKPANDALSAASFLKYEFVEKNGFSPPTKTEGGFVPKEPLPIDDELVVEGEFNASKLNEIFPATMHIIDITTAETNLTKIIEITTPDPFKDVIHTEAPPDLTAMINDTLQHSLEVNNSTENQAFVSNTTNTTTQLKIPLQPPTPETNHLTPTISEDKNSIESFLDILFKDDQEEQPKVPLRLSDTTSTIPPFKNLPQTTAAYLSTKPSLSATISTTSNTPTTLSTTITPTGTASQTTKRPLRLKSTPNAGLRNKTKINNTRRTTTIAPLKSQKPKNGTTIRRTTSYTTITTPTASAPITTKSPFMATTAATTNPPLLHTPTTNNPFLMSPFDKLPFMDASFEIKRQTPATATASISPLTKLDGLDAAYDISNAMSSSTTTTTMATASIASVQQVPPQHHLAGSSSSSNSLIDPTGILKLAGCNIYGRMYRVGRIILELSSACVECKCTETGVKCGQLDC